MKKKILIILILVAILMVLCIIFIPERQKRQVDESKVLEIQNIIKQEKYIIHAAGFVKDSNEENHMYTNSREALINCYEEGNRVCEIDFSFSKDNKLVCLHDWEQFYINGEMFDNKVDLNTFLNGKIQEEFTPIWIEDIVKFMKEHEDFYVVTDIKENNVKACKVIAEYCPELMDRFIIQIYHEREYNKIVNLGFNNVIYTLYETNMFERDINALQSFAEKKKLVGFTFWYYWADNSEFLNAMKETNVPIYVHTINDKEKRESYFPKGITATYTALTSNKD